MIACVIFLHISSFNFKKFVKWALLPSGTLVRLLCCGLLWRLYWCRWTIQSMQRCLW